MRRLLPALLMVAAFVALPAAAPAKYSVGISDHLPATFSNPLFAPLHLGTARYVTPWDTYKHVADKNLLQAWMTAAALTHETVLVAFEESHTRGQQRKLPSVNAYSQALRWFHHAYPGVKDFQPWNEVNRCQRDVGTGFIVGQPTCHSPKMAALYYLAAKRVFRGDRVTGLDVLDGPQPKDVAATVKYIGTFLRYVHPRPKYWGLHNYSDTNRFSSVRTKAILKATRSGQVWLTETGGIVAFSKSFPYSTTRATKAIGCMFTLAKSNPRITRLYVFSFFGRPKVKAGPKAPFDTGLLNPNLTPRPGYEAVKKRKARACHK